MYNVDKCGRYLRNHSHGGAALFVQLSRLLLFSAILNFIFQLLFDILINDISLHHILYNCYLWLSCVRMRSSSLEAFVF